MVELVISADPIEIINIRIEPTATSEKFMVIGRKQGRGVIIGLDFSTVFTRICGPGDYESWTPSDGKKDINGLKCLLGRDITYQRRYANATCFNNEIVEPVLSEKACACTEDDWEW